MNKSKMLFWLPRILGILFVLFTGMFAFDVFDSGLGIWGSLLAFVMHLLPSTFPAFIVLLVAWRREKLGAALYAVLAVWFLVFAGSHNLMAGLLAFCLPLIIIAILFWASWSNHQKSRQTP